MLRIALWNVSPLEWLRKGWCVGIEVLSGVETWDPKFRVLEWNWVRGSGGIGVSKIQKNAWEEGGDNMKSLCPTPYFSHHSFSFSSGGRSDFLLFFLVMFESYDIMNYLNLVLSLIFSSFFFSLLMRIKRRCRCVFQVAGGRNEK